MEKDFIESLNQNIDLKNIENTNFVKDIRSFSCNPISCNCINIKLSPRTMPRIMPMT